MNNNERFGSIEAMLADLLRSVDRLTAQMEQHSGYVKSQSGQIDDIIKILKMSDARHTQAEIRQDKALAAIEKQGQRLDEQSRRADANTEGLKQLLQAQAQMMGLLTHTSNRTDNLTQRDDTYEARFQRLEDAVFRKAS